MSKRIHQTFICAAVLASGGCHPAGGAARDVLQRAIQAHGGEANLDKTLTGTITASFDVRFQGRSVTASVVEVFQLPRQYKRVVDARDRDKKYHMACAVTDGQGWVAEDDQPARDVPGPPTIHWHTSGALLPSLLVNGADLLRIPDIRVDSQVLAGVKASRAEEEAEYYFDQKTWLLARVRRKASIGLAILNDTNEPQDGEVVLSDYKDVAGVKYPMEITFTAGKKTSFAIHIKDVQFLDHIDDAEFAKP